MNYSVLPSPNLLLPWYSTEDEDLAFLKIVRNFLIAFLILALLVFFYPLPEKTREEKEALPPELARVILEKKELPKPPPPKPKPEPKKEKPKPEPKKEKPKPEPKKEKPKPEPKKEKPKPEPKKDKPKPEPKKPEVEKPKPKVTEQQKLERARQEAATSLSAIQDDLAAIRDLTVDTAVNNNLARGASEAKQLDRSVISSGATVASGGINTTNLSRDTGGRTLSGRETTKVNSELAAKKRAADARKKAKGADGRQIISRSEEAIRIVISQNKAAIDTTYQRALRKNPGLEGRFVVKMIIQPNGSVSSVTIVSSELDDDDLEKKLLTRIRLINFGPAKVAATTVNYTFDFYPL